MCALQFVLDRISHLVKAPASKSKLAWGMGGDLSRVYFSPGSACLIGQLSTFALYYQGLQLQQ